MKIDKSKIKSGANLLTQALFLETNGWSISDTYGLSVRWRISW